MGYYLRGAEVDKNPSQTETQERSTVQGVGGKSDIAQGPQGEARSEGSHRSTTEDIINTVLR